MRIEKRNEEKLITKVITVERCRYISDDGNTFATAEECLEYEAKMNIDSAFESIVGSTIHDPYDLFFQFSSEEEAYIVKIKNEEDLSVVNNWLKHHKAVSAYSESGDREEKIVLGNDAIGKTYIFTNYWDGECYYCLGTADDLKRFYCERVDALCYIPDNKD